MIDQTEMINMKKRKEEEGNGKILEVEKLASNQSFIGSRFNSILSRLTITWTGRFQLPIMILTIHIVSM